MNQYAEEVEIKLKLIRQTLAKTAVQGVRLRGTDWFAWVTAGASNTVLLTAETGIAEVLVTDEEAWILTDEIEAERLVNEELPSNFKLFVNPWADIARREAFVRDVTSDGEVNSDRPISSLEKPLPLSLINHKRTMLPSELERYREVGRKASEAMTAVLKAAKPTWTEYQLAGSGAEALWERGLHPALVLAAGERRLPLYRHPLPTGEVIGKKAMLVFCARGYGLYANLTRFVAFESLSNEETQLHRHIREIEAQALNACRAGISLNEVYQVLAQAYKEYQYPNAIREHHQGGTTGYLSREIIANPTTVDTLAQNMAIALNPSLAGAKIEDTFILLKDSQLENLTFDPNFPNTEIEGRLRPLPLMR